MTSTYSTPPIKASVHDTIEEFFIPEVASVTGHPPREITISYKLDSCRESPAKRTDDEKTTDLVVDLMQEEFIVERHTIFIETTTGKTIAQFYFDNYFDPNSYELDISYLKNTQIHESYRSNGLGTKLRTLGISALVDYTKVIISYPTTTGGKRLNENHNFQPVEHPTLSLPLYLYRIEPPFDLPFLEESV